MTKKHRDVWVSPAEPARLYIRNTVPDVVLERLLNIPAEEIVVNTETTKIRYSSHRKAHTAARWARDKMNQLYIDDE